MQKTDLYFVGRLSIRTQWSNCGYDAKQYDEFATFHCLPAHSLTRLPLGQSKQESWPRATGVRCKNP
jgi:hypothetical protein